MAEKTRLEIEFYFRGVDIMKQFCNESGFIKSSSANDCKK